MSAGKYLSIVLYQLLQRELSHKYDVPSLFNYMIFKIGHEQIEQLE